MKTPEEVGKHAAWQAFFASKTHKKMFTENSLAAHITGAIKGDRLQRAELSSEDAKRVAHIRHVWGTLAAQTGPISSDFVFLLGLLDDMQGKLKGSE